MHFSEILEKLETGEVRAARKVDGTWHPNTEVKQAILQAFKEGMLVDYGAHHYHGFVDKDTLWPRTFRVSDQVRMVPGGSSVRRGAYVAPKTIIMPPSYINVGAYVDAGTMVDSHVLVGSCAQIGKDVHLSAGVQIGGVLEPIGQAPVVVEDGCFIGAGAILVEGVHICSNAVIAPGVKLSRSIPVYDCVNERLLNPGAPIPERAVVVPGSRAIGNKLPWAQAQGLSLACAIIIKYKDQKTESALMFEDLLR